MKRCQKQIVIFFNDVKTRKEFLELNSTEEGITFQGVYFSKAYWAYLVRYFKSCDQKEIN